MRVKTTVERTLAGSSLEALGQALERPPETEPLIPFNRFAQTGQELSYVQQAITSLHIAGDGPFTARCHSLLEKICNVRRALLCTSCTHALEMAAILLDIEAGDEVIVPSFTFVSTVNAFVLRGAKPVFVDVRPDTLNMDEAQIERLITSKTRAIVPVHYAGVGCEMDRICSIARTHGLAIVEDSAHGLFGSYRSQALGSFGELATLSFHETKNISCGEGGALLINDPAMIDRAEIIREKGTNRRRFFRGEVDKYSWVDVGSSYLPSEILAAVLCAQLEASAAIQALRRRVWQTYAAELKEWAEGNGVRLPLVPEHCEQAYHLFYMLLPSEDARARLIAHLRRHNIVSVFHYVPLHLSEMGVGFGGYAGQCPVTESASARLLRLPLYNSLGPTEQARVIEAILRFRP